MKRGLRVLSSIGCTTICLLGAGPASAPAPTASCADAGVSFEQAWPSRVLEKIGDLEVPFLGREALLQNKKASARPKDLADVDLLEGKGKK